MNIILCGYHWTGCKALRLLVEQNHNVFVFTHDSPYHIPSLKSYCTKLGVNYSLDNISKVKLPFTPDIVCSIYYRYIIQSHIIDICKGKIFNLHPSLLPKYRGCSSVTWAMIQDEKEVGFTYHYIDSGCDTGNIILQKSLDVEEWDTQESLYLRVMFESMKCFIDAFNFVEQGFPGRKQEGEASYFSRGCPFDGQIDPNWNNSLKERFIRAMIYPPYPVSKLGVKEVFTVNDLDDIE